MIASGDRHGGERRQLALVVDYGDLIAVLRARKNELGISNAELAEASELTAGYIGKCLVPPPGDMKMSPGRLAWRMLGPKSFGAILYSLGLALAVVEDAPALRQAGDMAARRGQYVRRDVRQLSASVIKLMDGQITRNNAREMGKKGGKAAQAKRPVAINRKYGRKGALIRWERVKAAAKGDAK